MLRWARRSGRAERYGARPPHIVIGRCAATADVLGRHATISYGKGLVARRIPLSFDAAIRA